MDRSGDVTSITNHLTGGPEMKHNEVFSTFILIAIVAMILAACAAFRDTSTVRSRWCLTDRTETKSLTYEMRAGMQKIEIEFEALIDNGSLAWKLTDPKGVLRWEDEIAAVRCAKDDRSFDTLEGEWAMDLDLEKFTGKFEVCWKAR
jgi:hypothetical protein